MAKRLAVVLVLVACAGGDELDELDALEQEQVDCRPVRIVGCFDAWNDRACFTRPPECAAQPEPPSP